MLAASFRLGIIPFGRFKSLNSLWEVELDTPRGINEQEIFDTARVLRDRLALDYFSLFDATNLWFTRIWGYSSWYDLH